MADGKQSKGNTQKQSLLNCLYEEIVKGSAVTEDDSNYLIKEQRIITFINIPWELEKVLYLGYLVCLDSFLFIFTFLPIRTVCAVLRILNWLIRKILFLENTLPIDKGHLCDLFKVTIMITCVVCLSWVNISMLYHIIRGQSVIKLYFIYNVLEIMDYLCISFGNDVLEALFWLTIRSKTRKREHLPVLWHWVLACIYTIIHSMCFLVQAICLSVAINSHNKSLLVVMTSNQYMELKSYLFKKFDYVNNYQIVARDIRERFSYTVVLVMVFVRNMSQLEWDATHVWDILPDVAVIVCSEVLIDWVKHAFVTKFNGIPVETYKDYRYQLYDDLLNPAHFHQTFSNRIDHMARKILFIPMPLACLTITVLMEVIPDDLQLDTYDYLRYGAVTIATLFIIKVINMGLILHNAELLRTPHYTPPLIPPIRMVNSSVRLRDPPVGEEGATLSTVVGDSTTLSTVDETDTLSTDMSCDVISLKLSRSAPELSQHGLADPLTPDPLTSSPDPLTPDPLSVSPDAPSSRLSNSSLDLSPLLPYTPSTSSTPENCNKESSPENEHPLDSENEPPLDNVRNMNNNRNIMSDGVRRRPFINSEL